MRRLWAPIGSALLVAVVLATASGAVAASARAFSAIPSTAGSKPINGVPDVTGAGNPHGSISLQALQTAAGAVAISTASVRIDGLSRGYLVIAPVQQHGPLPMIVILGGVSASPTQEAERDELMPLVVQGKAILVYPAGYAESWNVGVNGCCSTAAFVGVDDVGFVQAVTAAVRSSMSVSTSYLIGFSNGGKLAYQVLCQSPGLFSAAAIVGATPLTSCPSQVAVPMLIAVGAKDPELPQQGHTENPLIPFNAALTTWRGIDGCASTATSVVGVGTAVATTWTSCSSGARVVGVLYGGLDHEWPTAGLVGADVAGAGVIWNFLSTGSAFPDYRVTG